MRNLVVFLRYRLYRNVSISPAGNFLLLEDGTSFALLESSDKILLE